MTDAARKEFPDIANLCDSVENTHKVIQQMVDEFIVNPNEVVLLLKRKCDYLGHLVDDMVENNPHCGHSKEVEDIHATIRAYRDCMWLLTSKSYFDSISNIYKAR